ncbi:MAG: GDSL-type esterase/lipase family protein [Gemmiger sp.]
MPNKEGGYGGYSRPPEENRTRRVRTAAPATPPPREESLPPDFENTEWMTLPGMQAPPADASRPRPSAPSGPARQQTAAPPPPPASSSRTAAIRARQRRRARLRRQRRALAMGTVAAVLVLSGVITLLLPKSAKTDPISKVSMDTKPAVDSSLVAPLPYAAGNAGSAVKTVNWGTVGPAQQTAATGFTYTAAPQAAGVDVPAFGMVSTEWFADAAFLGDSLTAGFTEYGINVGGALICGYEGVSPNSVVNRTSVNHPGRGQEVALDVLAAAQPAKLYLLMGTNALGGTGNDEGFLNYYARMLDDLRTALPNTTIFVQSVLPVRPEVLDKLPGLSSDRLASINAAIRTLCAERGCLFLDLNAEFSDENGDLDARYAEADGVHLTVAGYSKWVSYLCAHVPYDKDNPYQPGTTYYLDDSIRSLLADLP